ncbi:cytochrome P450 [Streptomyces eurythermus]|uniref:cytochrome P450 n=1 Tax=Streptomyces eurythermus TaxID=42237 RepID=UPI0036D236B9
MIRECRRWECPLTWVLRRCSTDTELCGARLREGDLVCVNLASANRDETRWSDADRLDVHRRPLPHLAMGTGPHICLGRHLAALEADEVLAGLARTAPPVGPGRAALDTDGVEGRGFRPPRRLILRWCPSLPRGRPAGRWRGVPPEEEESQERRRSASCPPGRT